MSLKNLLTPPSRTTIVHPDDAEKLELLGRNKGVWKTISTKDGVRPEELNDQTWRALIIKQLLEEFGRAVTNNDTETMATLATPLLQGLDRS